jgi:light-regulated signal transduction histidine kinase (bacteriophytochrome)
VRDVEQQLYQSELKRRMDELVRINTELDEFTHFVSHDLREPLRKLVSFSDLLRGDLADNLPAQAEEDLHYIEDSAARMRALVDALLALSHAGKTPLVPQHVDMDEAVTRALDNLGLSIEESGAVISRTQLPPVTGDALLLTQLYQNLIGNALKYVPAGTSPQVSITYDPQSGAYGVKDNGIGINTVFFKQIFKPFKRLHSREEYEGSGIGLSICRKIMDRHQGKIWVESVHGQGAHFKFTLGTHLQTDATVTRL